MVCPRCGATIADGTRFCTKCGEDLSAYAAQQPIAQQPVAPNYGAPVQPQYDPMGGMMPAVSDPGKPFAIASLVCGILGVVFCWLPIGNFICLILAILGIVFCGIGKKKSTMAGFKPSGLATAGLVCGIIGTVFSGLGFICSAITCAALGELASPFEIFDALF